MIFHWLFWPFQAIFALGLESSAQRLMESRQWAEALAVYRRLIVWSPGQASFHTEMGLAHLMLDEPEKAEESFRAAILRNPGAFRAYDLLGVLLANQGRLEEARETWRRLIDQATERSRKRSLIYTYLAVRQVEEARRRLSEIDAPGFTGFDADPDVDAAMEPGSMGF